MKFVVSLTERYDELPYTNDNIARWPDYDGDSNFVLKNVVTVLTPAAGPGGTDVIEAMVTYMEFDIGGEAKV